MGDNNVYFGKSTQLKACPLFTMYFHNCNMLFKLFCIIISRETVLKSSFTFFEWIDLFLVFPSMNWHSPRANWLMYQIYVYFVVRIALFTALETSIHAQTCAPRHLEHRYPNQTCSKPIRQSDVRPLVNAAMSLKHGHMPFIFTHPNLTATWS